MTDSQLLVLGICIVFPISVLIFQIGFIVGALNRLNETLRSIRSVPGSDDYTAAFDRATRASGLR